MAVKTNLVIDQGSDFSVTINLTDANNAPMSLENFTGSAQMRKYYTSSKYYRFGVEISNGTVTLTMNAANTNSITPGRYVFDCEITSSNNETSRILEGISTVTPSVTR